MHFKPHGPCQPTERKRNKLAWAHKHPSRHRAKGAAKAAIIAATVIMIIRRAAAASSSHSRVVMTAGAIVILCHGVQVPVSHANLNATSATKKGDSPSACGRAATVTGSFVGN